MKHKLVFTLNPETKEISYKREFLPENIVDSQDLEDKLYHDCEQEFVLSDEEQTQMRYVLDQRSKLVSQEKFAKFKAKLDELEANGSMDRWFAKRQRQEKIYNDRIERFHQTYGLSIDKLNEVIGKIKAKYDSDEYIDREWKSGREPMTCLYDFLLDYVRKYGLLNEIMLRQPFASKSYDIGNYNVTLFCGQGSFIRVDLLTDTENDTE